MLDGVWRKGNPSILLVWPLWRIVCNFLKKLKTELPYDSAIPLLGIYPEKTLIQKDTCTPLFIAIAKMRKQPKYSSTEEWIKMWYMYTMQDYSALEKNEILSFAATWMQLEIILQSQSDKYHMTSLICGI